MNISDFNRPVARMEGTFQLEDTVALPIAVVYRSDMSVVTEVDRVKLPLAVANGHISLTQTLIQGLMFGRVSSLSKILSSIGCISVR